MKIIITSPTGTTIGVEVAVAELGPEGVETTMRQLADQYNRVRGIDVAYGEELAEGEEPEVETELEADE